MPKRNTKGMTEYNINRGIETRERVIAAIEQCKANGDISPTKVCEIAGISRSYFTKHPEMRKTLDIAIGIVNKDIKKRKQYNNSKDVLIKSLKAQIISLKKENASLQSMEKYKDLYEAQCKEMEHLKKTLDKTYHTNTMMGF